MSRPQSFYVKIERRGDVSQTMCVARDRTAERFSAGVIQDTASGLNKQFDPGVAKVRS